MDEYVCQFLMNFYCKNILVIDLGFGMVFINLVKCEDFLGEVIMSDEELNVFVQSFEQLGFNVLINWYCNFDCNWYLFVDVGLIVN